MVANPSREFNAACSEISTQTAEPMSDENVSQMITIPSAENGTYVPYGPPPWYFEGYSASIVLKADAESLRRLIPAPLKLYGDPVCRLSVHDMVCDYGLGERFMLAEPDQAQFCEAVFGVMVEYDGIIGHWAPYLWCTTDAELAVGRELYGWQQRLGEMSMTRPPLRRDWRAGDSVVAMVSRGRRHVFSLSISLDGPGDLPETIDGLKVAPDAAKANNHFTQTVLADPVERLVTQRLVCSSMEKVEVTKVWSGRGHVEVSAPELAFLRDATVLGGRWHELSWIKPWPDRLIGETEVQLPGR
jgi:acetoacetate decarboxylase